MIRLKKVGKSVPYDTQCFYGIFKFTEGSKNGLIEKDDIFFRCVDCPNDIYALWYHDFSGLNRKIPVSDISKAYDKMPKVQKYEIIREKKSNKPEIQHEHYDPVIYENRQELNRVDDQMINYSVSCKKVSGDTLKNHADYVDFLNSMETKPTAETRHIEEGFKSNGVIWEWIKSKFKK